MNTVCLIGRMTADAEVREVSRKGKEDLTIASFTLAVDRVGSEEADFIRCKAFDKTAEFIEDRLGKGQRIGVTGRINTSSYETDDGDKRYITEVIVERVTFADVAKDKKAAKDDDDDDRKERGRSRKQKGK